MKTATKTSDMQHAPDGTEWMCANCYSRTTDRHDITPNWTQNCFLKSFQVLKGSSISAHDLKEIIPNSEGN